MRIWSDVRVRALRSAFDRAISRTINDICPELDSGRVVMLLLLLLVLFALVRLVLLLVFCMYWCVQ